MPRYHRRRSKLDQMLDALDGRCWYCGMRVKRADVTKDHVVPRVDGGRKRDNIVPCCRACNQAKGRMPLETYRERVHRGDWFWGELVQMRAGATTARQDRDETGA